MPGENGELDPDQDPSRRTMLIRQRYMVAKLKGDSSMSSTFYLLSRTTILRVYHMWSCTRDNYKPTSCRLSGSAEGQTYIVEGARLTIDQWQLFAARAEASCCVLGFYKSAIREAICQAAVICARQTELNVSYMCTSRKRYPLRCSSLQRVFHGSIQGCALTEWVS